MVKSGKTDIYSLDLSNATDRLPVLLQGYILCFLLTSKKVKLDPKKITDSWVELISSFTLSTRVSGS